MAFTYFLRDLHTLELIVKHVLPYTAGRSHIQVWDAGCAMGQEPYSLAMLFSESMGYFGFKNLRIWATDQDSCNLFGDIIKNGLYQEIDVKRMPHSLLEKYFQPAAKPGSYRISELLRNCLTFRKHDLLSLDPIGGGFSLIVCKNVLLHFHYEERLQVIRMFHRSLAPRGYFATEQTQKMPPELGHLFEQVTPAAQIFRRIE